MAHLGSYCVHMRCYLLCGGEIQLNIFQNYAARFRETFTPDGLYGFRRGQCDACTCRPDGLYDFCGDSVTPQTGKFTANYFIYSMASSGLQSPVLDRQPDAPRRIWVLFLFYQILLRSRTTKIWVTTQSSNQLRKLRYEDLRAPRQRLHLCQLEAFSTFTSETSGRLFCEMS